MRVLNVRPKNSRLNPIAILERDALLSHFSDKMESKRITVFSDDVIEGINFYIEKKGDVGLLAMINRDSGAIIQKHFTHKMASQVELPLLIIPDIV